MIVTRWPLFSSEQLQEQEQRQESFQKKKVEKCCEEDEKKKLKLQWTIRTYDGVLAVGWKSSERQAWTKS